MTYWAINAVFLAVAAVMAVVAITLVRRGRRMPISWRALGISTAVLLVMTAVFDNVMIGIGLVGYDPSKISGLFIGIAPLEDFAYAIGAVILLPSVWIALGPRIDRGEASGRSRRVASARSRREAAS